MQIYYTTDEARTLEIARELGARLRAGDIVLLRGDMGAGKSVFARGLARGLGITSHITSPTFTTMQQYSGPTCNFYHFDLYQMCIRDRRYGAAPEAACRRTLGVEATRVRAGVIVTPGWPPERFGALGRAELMGRGLNLSLIHI